MIHQLIGFAGGTRHVDSYRIVELDFSHEFYLHMIVLKSSKNYMNLHFFQTFVWTTLLETVNLKPLIVALMLMLGQQLSGVNAVIFFSVTIFNAAKTSLPSLLENVIVGGKGEFSLGYTRLSYCFLNSLFLLFIWIWIHQFVCILAGLDQFGYYLTFKIPF